MSRSNNLVSRVSSLSSRAWATGLCFLVACLPVLAGSATIDWVTPDGQSLVRTVIHLPRGEVTQAHVRQVRVSVIRGTLGTASTDRLESVPGEAAHGQHGEQVIDLRPGAEVKALPEAPHRRRGGSDPGDAGPDWSGARIRVEPLAVDECYITRYEFQGMVLKNNYVEYDFVDLMSINARLGRTKKKGNVDLYIYDWAGNLACSSTRRGKYVDDCGALSLDCTNTAAAVIVKGVKKKTKYGLVVYMTSAY